jgi:ribonuclease BN (tRNA processing enzyme)
MDVRLTVIGSSPAWPNPGSAQSGYLVETESEPHRNLLLDCGPGVLGRLRANGGVHVEAMAITHFHLDHWGDLVPWAWLNAYGPKNEHIPCSVWLPPGGRSQLEAFAANFGNDGMFESAFELHEFEPGKPFRAAGFEVEAHRLPHYTMEEALAAADGPVLLTHRPVELPIPEGVRMATDGLVVDISGDAEV